MFGWLRKEADEPAPPGIVLTEEERELAVKVLNTAIDFRFKPHWNALRFGNNSGVIVATLFEQNNNLPNGWPYYTGYGVTVYDAMENLLGHISLSAKWGHQDEVKRKQQTGTDAPGEKPCE